MLWDGNAEDGVSKCAVVEDGVFGISVVRHWVGVCVLSVDGWVLLDGWRVVVVGLVAGFLGVVLTSTGVLHCLDDFQALNGCAASVSLIWWGDT